MNLTKFMVLVAALGGGYHLWNAHQHARLERALLASANSNGFIEVRMPDAAPPHTVLVFAPMHCPKEGARRADAMARQLSAMGIPNIRTSEYRARGFSPDEKTLMDRTTAVLGGAIPAVMIDGKGKSNPTIDEVAAEYRRNL